MAGPEETRQPNKTKVKVSTFRDANTLVKGSPSIKIKLKIKPSKKQVSDLRDANTLVKGSPSKKQLKYRIRGHKKLAKRKKKPFRIKTIQKYTLSTTNILVKGSPSIKIKLKIKPTKKQVSAFRDANTLVKGSPKKKKLNNLARSEKFQRKPVIVKWGSRYRIKHRVKFKKVKFYKRNSVIFMENLALKNLSFLNHKLMAQRNLVGVTVSNKKVILVNRYPSPAKKYSHFRRQSFILVSKCINPNRKYSPFRSQEFMEVLDDRNQAKKRTKTLSSKPNLLSRLKLKFGVVLQQD